MPTVRGRAKWRRNRGNFVGSNARSRLLPLHNAQQVRLPGLQRSQFFGAIAMAMWWPMPAAEPEGTASPPRARRGEACRFGRSPMSPGMLFGIAAAVLLACPLDARADDAHPRANDVQMGCEQFKDKYPTPGKTAVQFSATDATDSMLDKKQVSKEWWCVKITDDNKKDYKIKAKITSTYQRWVVLDSETRCQSVANKLNDEIKGFEQEHIDDVKPILEEFNKKLDEDVKPKEFCGTKVNDAINALKTASNDIAEHADTKYDGKAQDLDLGGKHTAHYGCSCAQH